MFQLEIMGGHVAAAGLIAHGRSPAVWVLRISSKGAEVRASPAAPKRSSLVEYRDIAPIAPRQHGRDVGSECPGESDQPLVKGAKALRLARQDEVVSGGRIHDAAGCRGRQ